MPTRLHIGRSIQPDAARAVEEAASQALAHVEVPALAVVFATDGYAADDLAAALARRLGNIPSVGCSAAGVFVGPELMRQGLVIGVLDSSTAFVGIGVAGPLSQGARAGGAAAAARALDQLPSWSPSRSRGLLAMLDVLAADGAEGVRGIVQEGGTGVRWAGGGAGDNLKFAKASLYARGRSFCDNAAVAAIDLPGRIGVGLRHGWRPYGPPTMVTRASGPVAHELEYEPAFEIYQRTAAHKGDKVTADDFSRFATLHPLGIPQADGEHVIRDPLRLEPGGGLRCVSEIPDGSLVRVMESTPDAMIEAAGAAGAEAARAVRGPVAGAFAFDCISRWMLLGDRFGEELKALQAGLGNDVPLLGCLSVGEIGGLGAGVPQFHNKTVSVMALPGW